jgi:hypothetical protein
MQLWRDAYGDQSITQVDIRPADIGQSPYEVAKYITKGNNLMQCSLDQLDEFARAVKGMRLWSASGCLKISDAEVEAEMIHHCDAEHETHCPVCGAVLQRVDNEWDWQELRYRPCQHPINWPMRAADRRRRRGETT